jgi:hypothetical protein
MIEQRLGDLDLFRRDVQVPSIAIDQDLQAGLPQIQGSQTSRSEAGSFCRIE